ncbi:lectin-like domain-containing protein [Lactococcus lactis]|uniref:lectin-like domain-containing protein n=1 Tax=Lactococcus lactis TaxID=1358 RepID=UPI001D192081|nr:bacterial Ig-like domain-containing protein [Lactococcus lactis]MCC4122022.1 bacterial Ig-like domain-containing protein [Lactococcus lactis]
MNYSELSKNIKSIFTLVIIAFSSLFIQIRVFGDSIPNLPQATVPLSEVFLPPVGNVPGIIDNKYVVLSDRPSQAGAMWGKYQVNLNYDFTMDSYMYFGNIGEQAADGITFTMQTIGNNISGDSGQNLGAYKIGPQGKKLNGIAVEFDTFHNGDGLDSDVPIHSTYDHTAFFDISRLKHLEYQTVINPDSDDQLSAGYWYKIRVSWTKSTKTLRYQLSALNSSDRFKAQDKSITLDTNSLFGSEYPSVYWGFTGSTGQNSSINAVAFSLLPQPSNQDVYWENNNTEEYTGYEQEVTNLIINRNALYNTWDNVETKIDISSLGGTAIPDINHIQVDGVTTPATINGNVITLPKTSITKGISQVKIPFKLAYKNEESHNLTVSTKGIEHVIGEDGQSFSYNDGKENKATLRVKEDKTNIKTKDSILYVGQTWNKESNFVSATNEDGTSIPWSDSRISSNGASVDTSKAGAYHLTYTIKGKLKNVDSSFTVTVKDDKSSIQTKNTTLQIGQTWNKESNFVSATDEDGNSIPWSDSRITSNGASVDTSKAGVTKLKYTYKGKVKNTDSEFTVTVEDPLKLIVPSNSDFGTYKLGSSNSVLNWNKSSKVEVEGANSSQWDLSVALSAKSSLKGYIKLGDQTISDQPQEVISGTGPMDVTGDVPSDNFIKVDYTGVKQLRKDTGNLEWTLTPSTKEVSE